MHLGKFEREVEYLDPGLPVEQGLVEPAREAVTAAEAVDHVSQHVDVTAPVKV